MRAAVKLDEQAPTIVALSKSLFDLNEVELTACALWQVATGMHDRFLKEPFLERPTETLEDGTVRGI